jgi:hypothetical protein
MPFGKIYRLCFPNGKSYIGQTHFTPMERYKTHCRDARNGGIYPVHYAIQKYGENNVIIETICTADSQEELDDLEIKYIAEYNSLKDNGGNGYNQTIGGGGTVGYKFTDEQRKNASAAQQQRKLDRPDLPQASSVFMTQFHKDHPEFAQNHSIRMRQRAKDHPEIGENNGKYMAELYEREPERRKQMSELKRKQNEENPEMAMRQSELKQMSWEDKDAPEKIQRVSEKTKQQWENPESRAKLMDEKRKRFQVPAFRAFHPNGDPVKDKDGNIAEFTFIPDCAELLFGERNIPNLGKAISGERKHYKQFTFSKV